MKQTPERLEDLAAVYDRKGVLGRVEFALDGGGTMVMVGRHDSMKAPCFRPARQNRNSRPIVGL